jgi:hypothetical protein
MSKIVKHQFVIMSNKRTRILKGRGYDSLELVDDTKSKTQILYYDSIGKAQQKITYNHGKLYWARIKGEPVSSANMHYESELEIVPVTVTTSIPEK